MVRPAATALRAPSVRDVERARQIVEQTGVFRSDEIGIAEEVFREAVDRPGKDYYALGAFEDDRLVGFTCFGPTPCTVATWDLYWIAVHPDTHRLGIGRRLMQAAEHTIQKHGGHLVVVETASRPDYAATRAFYEALDYRLAARISGYYAPGDDLVVYVKHLHSTSEGAVHNG